MRKIVAKRISQTRKKGINRSVLIFPSCYKANLYTGILRRLYEENYRRRYGFERVNIKYL